MARDLKYGEVILEHGTVADDEPVFVMRAQDKLAPQVMLMYRDLCVQSGSPENHLTGIADARDEFLRWQADHRTQIPRSDG